MGVKIVTDVDKGGFTKIADPYLDKLAKELGPHADKIKTLIRAINYEVYPCVVPANAGTHRRGSSVW